MKPWRECSFYSSLNREETGLKGDLPKITQQDKADCCGTSLVVQWLTICLPRQGTQVQSLVGELTSPHASGQLSPCTATKIPCAATKIRCSQINILKSCTVLMTGGEGEGKCQKREEGDTG